MSEGELYDFCLDWQMGVVEKHALKAQFKASLISYKEFEARAKARKWFVLSMCELENI